MQFEQSIYISDSPKNIYLAYENVSNWAVWDSETESASLSGEFVVGTTGKIKPKNAPESKIELIEVTKDKSFTVECGLPLCKMHFVHLLDQEAEGTKVTNQLIFSGFLAPIFSRLFGNSINRSILSSLNGLKKHIDSRS